MQDISYNAPSILINEIPVDDFDEGKYLCSIKPNGRNMIEHIVLLYSITLLLDFPLMLAWHIHSGMVAY